MPYLSGVYRYSPDPALYAAVDLRNAHLHERRVDCPAWAVARLHNVRVCYAPRSRLDGDLEHFDVLAGRPHVLLRRGLSKHAESRLVAHGLGHYVLWRRELMPEGADVWGRPVVEDWCDAYADALFDLVSVCRRGQRLRDWGR